LDDLANLLQGKTLKELLDQQRQEKETWSQTEEEYLTKNQNLTQKLNKFLTGLEVNN
jgi:hypothetical protein